MVASMNNLASTLSVAMNNPSRSSTRNSLWTCTKSEIKWMHLLSKSKMGNRPMCHSL